MSFEIPQVGVREKLTVVLPKTERSWDQQVDEERNAYEKSCRERFVEYKPFEENMYSKPKIPFGPFFVHLAEANYGASTIGAYRLYEVLNTIPDGYSYHGKVKYTDIAKYQDQGVKIVGGIAAFDNNGKLMPGYVNVAVQNTPVSVESPF